MVCRFLEGKSPDHRGRFLGDIRSFEDQKIESVHDFIQWLFPLDEPSGANPNAPVLDMAEIEAIRQSERASQNLLESSQWYLNFLTRNSHWICEHDHNHLRISRVIKSLRLLHSDRKADEFKQSVLALIAQKENEVGALTLKYWERA